MKTIGQIWIVLAVLAFSGTVIADDDATQRSSAYPAVPLADVLEAVSKKTGRTFLTSSDVPAAVIVGQLSVRNLDYSSLLIVLSNNDLAAITVGDLTNIERAAKVRQQALPLVFEDDDTIDDYEWVTRIVNVRNANAPQMVPILRPLVPQMGHMVANKESNSLIIAARYGNTKRLIALIREMDERTTPQDQK